MSASVIEAKPVLKWRVVDIAVASVIGVASALIYWFVAFATAAPWSLLEGVVPGLAGIFNGLWLFAGPLAAIIVRKPGAALYAEIVAGVLEALMGNMWEVSKPSSSHWFRVCSLRSHSPSSPTKNGTSASPCSLAH